VTIAAAPSYAATWTGTSSCINSTATNCILSDPFNAGVLAAGVYASTGIGSTFCYIC